MGLTPNIPESSLGNTNLSIATLVSLVILSVIAVSSVVMIIWDFSHRAGVYKVIGEQCRDIARECIQLWHQNPLATHAINMITEFEIRITNVTKEETMTDSELNGQCDKEAERSVARLKEQTGW